MTGDFDGLLEDAQMTAEYPKAQVTPLFIAAEIVEEVKRARTKHSGPMHGPHEGYAVILEELDELWDEVRAQKQDRAKMRKEALQVAAMALRFIEDVCDRT